MKNIFFWFSETYRKSQFILEVENAVFPFGGHLTSPPKADRVNVGYLYHSMRNNEINNVNSNLDLWFNQLYTPEYPLLRWTSSFINTKQYMI